MGKDFIVGVDHGNGNIKTAHCVFPCGRIVKQSVEPSEIYSEDVIAYKGSYYTLASTRAAVKRDKTMDEDYFIYTLFAIAREIVQRKADGRGEFDFRTDFHGFTGKDIVLAAGLPPQNFEKQHESFEKYFNSHFQYGADFLYNRKKFNFHVSKTILIPQGFAAVQIYYADLIRDYDTVYCIDIGDGTADLVTFIDGRPQKDGIASLNIGISHLRKKIIDTVSNDYQFTLSEKNVESVMMPTNRKNGVPQDIRDLIDDMASDWAAGIVREFSSRVDNFKYSPTVFVGGGSILLKKYLLATGDFSDSLTFFVDDIKANAIAYEKVAAVMLKAKGR